MMNLEFRTKSYGFNLSRLATGEFVGWLLRRPEGWVLELENRSFLSSVEIREVTSKLENIEELDHRSEM